MKGMRLRVSNYSTKEKIAIFLEFVEIQTKIASFFPMIIGLLWASILGTMNIRNTIIFFFAVLFFDMTTTAINNTMDYYKAVDEEYMNEVNVIGRMGLPFKTMVIILFTLLGIAFIFSIALVFTTDPLLLFIGAACYLIGITYTFGPLPLSRLPLGEIFSGVTMGFGIPFLANFINHWNQLLTSTWRWSGQVFIEWNWLETLFIGFISIPLIVLIANIMLANNIRDIEKDIANERYTLVYYIKRNWAVRLYIVLSVVPWICWGLYILTGILPWWAVVGFIALIPHSQSVRSYLSHYKEPKAFGQAVKSFTLFSLMYVFIMIGYSLSVHL